MKPLLMMIPLFLSACVATDASFKDVQRRPPLLSEATTNYLLKNERPIVVWLAETVKKCNKFGCVE